MLVRKYNKLRLRQLPVPFFHSLNNATYLFVISFSMMMQTSQLNSKDLCFPLEKYCNELRTFCQSWIKQAIEPRKVFG